MNSPIVSIIIPTYNYGKYIEETLDSIKSQTLIGWECIIIDDGSTDNTKQLVNQYIQNDKRFLYHYKKNAGLSAARNSGIKLAKGKYIQFLDADDLIENQKLDKQINILESIPYPAVIFGEYQKFYETKDGKQFEEWSEIAQLKNGRQDQFRMKLIEKNRFPPCAPVFPLEIAKQIRFDEKLTSYEDWDYWLKLSELIDFYYYKTPNSAALVRFHENSMSANTFRMVLNEIDVRNKLSKKLQDKYLLKINKEERKSAIKTALYLAVEMYKKKEVNKNIFLILYEKIQDPKVLLLKYLSFFPQKLLTKIVWIIFEEFKNVINAKRKFK
jgi:glycosyltransferase involved in cell wall biosynthesis